MHVRGVLWLQFSVAHLYPSLLTPHTLLFLIPAMDFEEEREANIARNRLMLEALGLDKNVVVVKKPEPKQKQKAQRKRKEAPSDEEEDEVVKPPRKAAAVVADAEGGPRRSGRNAGKAIDYAGDGDNLLRDDGPRLLTDKAKAKEMAEQKSSMKRVNDPCVAFLPSASCLETEECVQQGVWLHSRCRSWTVVGY